MTGESPPAPTPPPGWYADPESADTRRHWDGQGWSEHIPAMATPWYLQPPAVQTAANSSALYDAEQARLDTFRRRGWIWFLVFLPGSIYYGIRLLAGGRGRQGRALIVASLVWWVVASVLISHVAHAEYQRQVQTQPLVQGQVQNLSTPSERIDYGALDPKIRTWATRAGVTVKSVRCPHHTNVRVGGTFHCRLTKASGDVVIVVVTLAASDGAVTWTAP